ncbi:MAG: FKBP-type peptidyl-prolyl cis-trans isomerase [Spirochaetales bacterium]|nr:FKBP-type peptidyl-prolyl cis-trans isomerase [Spirochaetales bacterium]
MKKNLFVICLVFLSLLAPLTAVDREALSPGLYAVMETAKGEMVFELDYAHTPLTVTSFVGLAENTIDRPVRENTNFYDGLTFYRDIENYALFSGDPLNNGEGDPGYTLPREQDFVLSAAEPGTLVMTGLATESNGAGFFITKGEGDSFLDRIYTPFGRIVEGEKVLNKLTAGDKLTSLTILRRGAEAESFKTDNESFIMRYTAGREKELVNLETEEADVAAVVRSLEGYSKTMSGIYYYTIYEGFGDTPQMGDTVSVHYTGALPNGTVFDSSVERGQPYSITIGTDSVIPGWLEAILAMKTGEVRTIVIPPELAYGERGAGEIIPPNSWLIFQIQLLAIE